MGKTPPMKPKTDIWLETRVLKAVKQGCTIEQMVERLNVDKSRILFAMRSVMIRASKPAVHKEHGKVRVFTEGAHYLFHHKHERYIDVEPLDTDNFKCPPLD